MTNLDWLTRQTDIRTTTNVLYRLLEEAFRSFIRQPRHRQHAYLRRQSRALMVLLQVYTGQVKCVYIDTLYNMRSAFDHYDDNMEHSKWLAMM